MHEIKTKEKIHQGNFRNLCTNFENEEICVRILNKELHVNLCTTLNKPTRLHQDRHLRISSFDNYLVSLKNKSIKIISKFQPSIMFVRIIYHSTESYVCVFEVFFVTHQPCDNHQGQFAIMFREDSQINLAEENIILNVSLKGPLLTSACTPHLKPIISLKCVN